MLKLLGNKYVGRESYGGVSLIGGVLGKAASYPVSIGAFDLPLEPGFGLFFEPGGRPSRVSRFSVGGLVLPLGRPRCSFWTRAIWPPRGEGSFSA